jgi:RNA polymerase sigma-70 factor (ECF subfamily)
VAVCGADVPDVDPQGDLDRLVDAARAGDGNAFGQLWELLGGRVHGYFRAYGCRDAEDLTSETFLAAFSGLGGVVGDGAAFRTWLFSIAHHKRVDDLRRRNRRPILLPYEPDLDRRTSGPDDEPSLASGTADVVALLADLAPDQRDVLALRFVADLSLEQVAATLGRSVGAVKALQHRGLEALRRRAVGPVAQGRTGDGCGMTVSPESFSTNAEA